MPLKCISINCRGLHKTFKRKSIFNLCKKYDISCLQETYISDTNFNAWKLEWPGVFFHISGSNNSNGLIILVNNKFNQLNDPKVVCSDKRILGLEFLCDNKKILIVNVYAPNVNKEKEPFFNKLTNFLEVTNQNDYEYILLCGDWNSVLDNSKDIIAGLPHGKKEINLFQ